MMFFPPGSLWTKGHRSTGVNNPHRDEAVPEACAPGRDISILCPLHFPFWHRHWQAKPQQGHHGVCLQHWALPELFGHFHTTRENHAMAKTDFVTVVNMQAWPVKPEVFQVEKKSTCKNSNSL